MQAPLRTETSSITALPLPVAKLARRSLNAKSARDRHDGAWYALEVSVRIAVAAAMPADARELARGALGVWVAALRPAVARIDDPALLALHELCARPDGPRGAPRPTLSARELLDALVQYRNQVVGHGSQRMESFYEHAGEVLAQGLEAAWRAGLFLPTDAKLVYVESIAIDARSRARVRAFDLTGESPRLVPIEGEVPGLRSRALYLSRGATWGELHPWCLYDEERERVLCFNGLGRRAQYLDFASGAALSGVELEAAHPGITDELRARLETTESAQRRASSATPTEDPELVGDCRLLHEIGAGESSKVHLARQESLGRLVAVKMFSARSLPNVEDLARFEREIDALARCEHPNVVKVLTRGRHRGVPWFAMEHIRGAALDRVFEEYAKDEDLTAAVRRASQYQGAAHAAAGSSSIPGTAESTMLRAPGGRWEQLARFFAEAADGLHHMHKRGILHRDLRPSNLMATLHATRPVIMDLGFVALDGQTITAGAFHPTRKLATERYQAPEVLQREHVPVDGRCDVYSLAAVLYEFCTLHPLFETNDSNLAKKILHELPRDPCALRADLPRTLGAILTKALKKNPDERQSSASELARELRAFASAPPLPPDRAGALQPQAVQAGAPRVRLLVSIVLAAIVLVLIVAWMLL